MKVLVKAARRSRETDDGALMRPVAARQERSGLRDREQRVPSGRGPVVTAAAVGRLTSERRTVSPLADVASGSWSWRRRAAASSSDGWPIPGERSSALGRAPLSRPPYPRFRSRTMARNLRVARASRRWATGGVDARRPNALGGATPVSAVVWRRSFGESAPHPGLRPTRARCSAVSMVARRAGLSTTTAQSTPGRRHRGLRDRRAGREPDIASVGPAARSFESCGR